jgi:hypothetical protein
MTSPTTPTAHLIIRGTHAGAFVVAALWATAGLLVASLNRLAWLVFAFMFIGGVALFLLIGWYQRSKALAVFPDHLELSSWFGHQRIPLHALTSFSLRTALYGRSLQHAIVCWGTAGQELGQIPTIPFRKDQLAQLLAIIQSDHPAATIDRELERFLGTT